MASFEEVFLLSQVSGFSEQVSSFGFIRTEMVRGRSLVDGELGREMYYHRQSFGTAVSGDFTVTQEMPYGFATVSGA